MKKAVFGFIFVVIVSASVFSQNEEGENIEKNFTIQSSPVLFVYSLIGVGIGHENGVPVIMDLEGQYRINDIYNLSLTLSFKVVEYPVYDYTYGYDTSYYVNEFQINIKPMFIYRPFKTGLKGAFVGIYPNFGLHTYDNIKDNVNLRAELGIGINSGYKWVFKNGFTLQLGGGIGKTWSIPEKPDFYMVSRGAIGNITSDGMLPLNYFDLLLDFKLGYSF
ncbi:MAG: hypothetical protein LBH44_10605 [Treponema sp.]|jgi:hypothetical protein|nr:hypothetical protein [Treponema sp.]